MKGTKWNILNYIKNEQEYYSIFFNNCKDQLNRDQSYEVEISDQERNKLEDSLNNKIIKLFGDVFDEMKRKSQEGL